MVTKGYGFTVDDIDWSCPADLEPYAKAHNLELMERDAQMHSMGKYNEIAFSVVMAHFGAGLAGKDSQAEYIEKPFMQMDDPNRELTEEEKQIEIKRFIEAERARREEWKRKKKRAEMREKNACVETN